LAKKRKLPDVSAPSAKASRFRGTGIEEHLLFDVDRNFVRDITDRFDPRSLAASLAGHDDHTTSERMRQFGRELMRDVVGLADGPYYDGTAEMIDWVGEVTSTSFPHRLQRYIELCFITSRPLDPFVVIRSTPSELVLKVPKCTFREVLTAALSSESSCRGLCLAAFDEARAKTEDDLSPTEVLAFAESDGHCVFRLSLARKPTAAERIG
jgi:hypothetical protein